MSVLKLPLEQKTLLIENIQTYFEMERSENIGELAAGNLLDFMVKQLGPILYNHAIQDVRTIILQQMDRFDEEIHALEQPTQLTNRR